MKSLAKGLLIIAIIITGGFLIKTFYNKNIIYGTYYFSDIIDFGETDEIYEQVY